MWAFVYADAPLEKRVWMEPGANTTYVRCDLARASAPITLSIKVMANYRDHHGSTQAGDWRMRVESVEHGLRVVAFGGATPLHVLSNDSDVVANHTWYRGYFLPIDDYRGLGPQDDHLHVWRLLAELQSGEALLIVASTEAAPDLDPTAALDRRRAYEEGLLKQSGALNVWEEGSTDVPLWKQHLILAADQFIVRGSLPEDPESSTIIAGYPWFGDWGRDTMISLPSLTLARPTSSCRPVTWSSAGTAS